VTAQEVSCLDIAQGVKAVSWDIAQEVSCWNIAKEVSCWDVAQEVSCWDKKEVNVGI
jgi:hypothetical protein